MRVLIRSAVFALSLSFSTNACVIVLGPGDGSGEGSSSSGGGQTTSLLPGPDNTQGDPWNLTPEQQARREEVERWVVENVYKGYKILRTVQDPHGDIIDWIAPESMEQLPYALPEFPLSVDQLVLPAGVELAQSELEKYPELFGPVGSTPFHRPMYWKYVRGETGATSIQDYLDNYRDAGEAGAPVNRLYAGLVFDSTPNRGVSGFMNQFAPRVETDSLSLMEFAVVCEGAPGASVQKEQIGIVLSLDKHNTFWDQAGHVGGKLQDDQVRLHVESFQVVNGVKVDPPWDYDNKRFVPNPFNIKYPLGSVVPVSTPGGKQVEHWPALFQAPGGDWWAAYNGWLLGYFKGSDFTLLNKGGCSAHWYLEVLDQKPGTAWVQTEMGTGKFYGEAAPGEAAWVRMPMYLDSNGVLLENTTDSYVAPQKDECYTRSPLTYMGPGLGWFFLAGGPGGYNPLCTK